jgi:hypothetical protein
MTHCKKYLEWLCSNIKNDFDSCDMKSRIHKVPYNNSKQFKLKILEWHM